MRLVFMVTGEIAEPVFARALASDHEIVGLVTQPDRPVGRKQILTPPQVKEMAQAAGVPVIQPEKVSDSGALETIRGWQPELIVVLAYGQILPQTLIAIPSRAIINLHASLLPKYRGASCIQAALLNGDPSTGWSVIHVVKRLDAGNIILKRELIIRSGETGGELHDRLAALGPSVLDEALALLAHGEVPGEAQEESAQSYAPKLTRADGALDWSQAAAALERQIRAFDPWPGTSALLGGKRLKIFPPVTVGSGQGGPGECLGVTREGLEIACGEGSLVLAQVQPEGRRRMSGAELARGHESDLAQGLK